MRLFFRIITLSSGMYFLGACAQVPEGKDAIDALKIQGAPRELDERLNDGLATQTTPTLWGIKRIYEYKTLDRNALESDLKRVERELRRRGYYEGSVSAARIIHTKENHVRVEIKIIAGVPIKIRELKTTGLAQLPFDAAQAASQEVKIRVGQIFDEDSFEQAKQDVANNLSNRGYAFARVSGRAKIDLANHSASVSLAAKPGLRATIGVVKIEGLEQLDEGPIRKILQLKKGDRYSRRDIQFARAALFQLGTFSRVEVVPHLKDPNNPVVPITVRVQESALRDVTLGAGARLDLLRLAVVAQGGWTHRNFLGGLRKFSVTTRPGLTFFPTSTDNLKAWTAIFPENALTARLEQPGFIEGRTRGFTELAYNIYPLLYPLPEDTDSKEERVIGYQEIATSAGAERLFLGRLVATNLSLNWQANFPFNYQGDDEFPGLEEVIVGYPELFTALDLRDDPVQPKSGFYFSNSLQVAIPMGSTAVQDVRLRPEVKAFIPLDRRRKLILATRLGIGMVFPTNYGDSLIEAGNDLDYTDPAIVADQHKLLFRAFYSGGSNSNRGYPFQRIGPQGAIGFLIPSGTDCTGAITEVSSACLRPLGGFSLWEASIELRYQASKNFSLVGFMDASDVNVRTASFTLAEPHVSIGPGMRYLSPIGPLRVDLGWRVPGLQKLRTLENEPPDISDTPPYLNQAWFNSFAFHILIGEAF